MADQNELPEPIVTVLVAAAIVAFAAFLRAVARFAPVDCDCLRLHLSRVETDPERASELMPRAVLLLPELSLEELMRAVA